MKFDLQSPFKPMGDQIVAIQKLKQGIEDGVAHQVLLGVTGSGKTFTMANVIQEVQRPALVIAHNKTLAAQLCNELRAFFPENRIEFFVSYYDYYQPESYIVSTDTYIEKDMSINEEIDRLRHSATSSLAEREDVIVVASVSCIYGLGAPEEYYKHSLSLRPGDKTSRDALVRRLIELNYKRNDVDFLRATFRVRGDVVDIIPPYANEIAVRVEFFGSEVEKISEIEVISGRVLKVLKHVAVFPATHFMADSERKEHVLKEISADLQLRLQQLEAEGKTIEAYRLKQRTNYDIEMIREVGYCTGIENYSRYFDGREPGTPPFTLIDYFKNNFILFIDESHMTLPQIRAMYNGDLARKKNLVDYGFRLPAAFDNRPLKFDEFNKRVGQTVFISATPASYELQQAKGEVVEQIIRPTGLLDPEVEVRKTEGQIDDLISEIKKATKSHGRVLITTLTKKMAETLTSYLTEFKIKVRYLHSEIDTLERIEIVNGLRRGDFDVVVGINLLREGLDIPEIKLVAILDADKEGFLRSETSLIQTIGRAARNAESKVILYADRITDSMQRAITETNRRRSLQDAYNKTHGIVPKTIIKDVTNTLTVSEKPQVKKNARPSEILSEIDKLKVLMQIESKNLNFEKAIEIRDEIETLKKLMRK